MDEIQKVLIKAGRSDLAQKYYKKVASAYTSFVKKYMNDHEGASIADAAAAWKKDKK